MSARARIVAMAAFAAVAALGIAMRPVLPVDETRYLTVAWEMWQGGDVLVPHLNGLPYSHKPPVLFWSIDLLWFLTGVHEWSGRAVAPVLALIAMGLTGLLADRLWPDRQSAGTLAVVTMAGTAGWVVFAGATMFDAPLAVFVVWAWLALLRSDRRGDWVGWTGLALAIGGGVLTKGPVALLFMLAPALGRPIWRSPASPVRHRRWWWSLAASVLGGAAVALAWAIPAGIAGGPEFRDMILWGQTAGRVVASFAHARPFWFYLAILPLLSAPVALMPSLWRACVGQATVDRGVRFLATIIVPAIVVLSVVSGKQAHYVLPLLPAAAALFGRAASLSGGRAPTWGDRAAAALLPVLAGACLILAPIAARLAPGSALGAADDLRGFLGWPLLAAGLLLAGAASTVREIVIAATAASIATIAVANAEAGLGALRRYDLAPIAAALAGSEGAVATTRAYQGEYGFLAKLDQPVEEIEDPAAWIRRHPNGTVVDRAEDVPDAVQVVAEGFLLGRAIAVWRMPQQGLE